VSRRTTVVALSIGLTVLAVPLVPWGAFLAQRATPTGLRVAGEPVASTASPAFALGPRADAWLDEDVRVDLGAERSWHSRRELGVTIDLDALEARALGLGRSGDPLRDVPALWSAWRGTTDLEWPVRVDEGTIRGFVRAAAARHDRPARGAILEADGRSVEESVDGRRVRRAEAVRALLAALREGRRSIVLPVDRLPAPPPTRRARPAPRPVLIARYVTQLRTHGGERSRAHNVRTAAGYLDGAVLAPHGRLSFNERVGARDRAHGYRDAHVIFDGEMVDGIGGGVCQVASTLHGAAFLGGLEIARHQPHSRPSEYIPMGLDATVVWPTVDLVIQNPFPFEVRVRAYVRDVERGAEMTVELWGAERPREVEWRTEIVATEPWSDRYVEDATVPAGEERVSQRGIRGFVVLRERTIRHRNGVEVERQRLTYPPTDRIVRVAPGTLDPTGQPAGPPAELTTALPTNPF
jgi:vancomycin resistance protein YoaR